jgi:hypothetical protein
MPGDNFPLSLRLRNSAIRAISEAGRPLAVHEIEGWLKANDHALSQELTTKCYDYVRIILSLSPTNVLVKYRPVMSIDGIDHRALFYGIASKKYDPHRWLLGQEKHYKRKRDSAADDSADSSPVPRSAKRRSKPAKVQEIPPSPTLLAPPPKVLLFANAPAVPVIAEVDSIALANAWDTLTCVTLPDAPLWTELMVAMNELKTEIQTGTPVPDVVESVMRDHAAFVHPLIAHDVAVILTKEAYAKKEEIPSPPDAEFWVPW